MDRAPTRTNEAPRPRTCPRIRGCAWRSETLPDGGEGVLRQRPESGHAAKARPRVAASSERSPSMRAGTPAGPMARIVLSNREVLEVRSAGSIEMPSGRSSTSGMAGAACSPGLPGPRRDPGEVGSPLRSSVRMAGSASGPSRGRTRGARSRPFSIQSSCTRRASPRRPRCGRPRDERAPEPSPCARLRRDRPGGRRGLRCPPGRPRRTPPPQAVVPRCPLRGSPSARPRRRRLRGVLAPPPGVRRASCGRAAGTSGARPTPPGTR